MTKEKKENILPESKTKTAFEYIEMIIMCVCFIMLIFAFGIRICVVDGESMETTLQNGDIVITSDIFYEPKQNDIVVFHVKNEYYNKPLIKRVIATEGQWIDIKRNGNSLTVTIYEEDDVEFKNPIVFEDEHAYYSSLNTGFTGNYTYPVKIPKGFVFVMGDNRWNSSDSRSPKVGLVDKRIIFGQVLFRAVPINNLTLLTD